MLKFRNVVGKSNLNNWADNGKKQVGFCRGNKGFIAFHNEEQGIFNATIPVCLPKGLYYNIFGLDNAEDDDDMKNMILVDSTHKANVFISNDDDFRMIAFHINSVIFDKKDVEEIEKSLDER